MSTSHVLQGFLGPLMLHLPDSIHMDIIILALCIVLACLIIFTVTQSKLDPPSLFDPVPYLFNTTQFIANNHVFMQRAQKALGIRPIIQFHLGTRTIYLVTQPKNVASLFKRSQVVNNENTMLKVMLPVWYKFSKANLRRFGEDKSGRGPKPLPGTEDTPRNQRYFYQYEHIHTEYLSKKQYLQPLTQAFTDKFTASLDRYPTTEWTELSVLEFCKQTVTADAIYAIAGPRILDLNPDFLDAFWKFDHVIFTLAMGFLPRWLHPGPHRVHDAYLAMIQRYLDAAWSGYDWGESEAWEPHFGARVCRELALWLRQSGFTDPQSEAGALGILIWAQNSNVVPTLTWTIMEVVRDKELHQALIEEIQFAFTADETTGTRVLDSDKITSLPLLTSVYTEILRLHMDFNIQRDVNEAFDMDGYRLHRGAMVQAPTSIAHYEEQAWAKDGHAASEFWAERHVQVDTSSSSEIPGRRKFVMANRSGSYFPYGGGSTICPGRFFAKTEIMTVLVLLLSKFDIEFVEWTTLDKKPSDRPAQGDTRYAGAGATPPDRDMKIRWRRKV